MSNKEYKEGQIVKYIGSNEHLNGKLAKIVRIDKLEYFGNHYDLLFFDNEIRKEFHRNFYRGVQGHSLELVNTNIKKLE